MAWVELVTLLALVQLLAFGVLVGRARGRYGIKAPAMVGHPVFERYSRIQINTIETLVLLLPALWISARYWPPRSIALIGAVYLVGRMLYCRAYARDPAQRSLGYALSGLPTVVLIVAALIGVVRSLLS
jgi:glutathione S-transferase